MSEKVIIPEASRIKTVSRPRPSGRKDKFRLYKPGPDGVAPMPAIGDGYNVHVTGLTHDERGYPVIRITSYNVCYTKLLRKPPE